MPSTVIVIPACKLGEGLIGRVRDLQASSDCPVVIIDDGSGASFSSLFKTVADFPGVTLLRNAVNIGKGAALKHGFNQAEWC
jgi:dolichol-phosphate mannosyltransferase